MQIAIATSNGKEVDRHFGKTDSFFIYKEEGGSLVEVARRTVSPYSSGSNDHDFDESRFMEIFQTLADCDRLYCTKIGDKPKGELLKRGVETIEYQGEVRGIPM